MDELAEASLRDARIARLVALTSVQESQAYNREFPKSRLGEVTVVLRDGRRLRSGTLNARGGPEQPLSEREIVAKFRDYASPALGSRRARDLERAVLELPENRGDFPSVIALTSGALG